MSTHNSNLREIRLKYRLAKAKLQFNYEEKEQEISSEIEMARNERSYWLTKVKKGEELEHAKNQIDLLTEKITQLKSDMIDYKFDTRNALILLERDKFIEIDQIEQEARQKGGAES